MSRTNRTKIALIAALCGGWAFQASCARNFQREIEVLLAPQSNPLLIRDSFLVNLFGPQIIKLFND